MNAVEELPERSRRGLIRYESNPFLPDASASTNERLKRRTMRSKDGSHLMVMSQAGDFVAPAGFWHSQEVDRAQFIKLYVNGVKAFAGLSGAGAQVFGLVYAEMQKNPGKDVIYLHFPDVDQAITPISKATYMRGMREILLKRFLAETLVTGRYFVNPDYIFNGDRLAFVKEYRLKRDKTSDQAWREQLEARGQQRLPVEDEAIDGRQALAHLQHELRKNPELFTEKVQGEARTRRPNGAHF